MKIVYALEPLPPVVTKTLFLAGPTPRKELVGSKSWRPDALRILEAIGFNGEVIVPEDRAGEWQHNYDHQVDWEFEMREAADLIFFWIPRDLLLMPAFTTNIEWGEDYRRGRTFYGRPDGAPKTAYLDRRWREVTGRNPHNDLAAMLKAGLETLKHPLPRCGGERFVPAHIWRTKSFQEWYRAQLNAGNRLDGFRVVNAVAAGKPHADAGLFAWIGQPKIWIAAEERCVDDEFVVGRSDLSSVVAIHGRSRADAKIVLTEEFRSAVRNEDGLVVGPASGSSHNAGTPELVALEELAEEMGLTVADESRLVRLGSRQVAPTILSHQVDAFALQLTDTEFARLRSFAESRTILGHAPERITLRIVHARDLNEQPLDWASKGMIFSALDLLYG